ncbi:hypothetical protein QE152_g8176 [Popillia japonica]|uniref:Reverse transcriptase domain-containing protein n=1 Tax=Popillia japonica TaxID=7064 RepID=A0AAW1M4W8_POPJA
MKEEIRQCREANRYTKINIVKLKNIEIRQKYYQETEKRLGEKWNEARHQGLEELWKSFKNILSETSKEICGTKSVNRTKKAADGGIIRQPIEKGGRPRITLVNLKSAFNTVQRDELRQPIEKGGRPRITLVNLKSAFNTVQRDELWNCLEELEVTRKPRQVIESVYQRVIGQVRINGKVRKEFKLKRRIKQGIV